MLSLLRRAGRVLRYEGVTQFVTKTGRYLRNPRLYLKGPRLKYYEFMKCRGVDVMKEDWDTLIILDGCRYDMFTELNTLDGRLESRLSKGSCTGDFLRENFRGRTFDDTVYVTANPIYVADEGTKNDMGGPETFHAVYDVWQEHWDPEYLTVQPEEMVDPVKRAHEEYPNKRLLVHFIQPHRPWIGETGRNIQQQSGSAPIADLAAGADRKLEGDRAWALLEHGEISHEEAKQAYYENLEITFPHVKEILDYVDGKSIVTSDHGNMMGELATPFPIRVYGHPCRYFTKRLVKVPWLVVESGLRREIMAESTTRKQARKSNPEADTEKRLRDLGYV